MEMTIMKTKLLLAAAGLALSASVAFADAANRLNVPRGEWLSVAQVTEKLQAQGYTVREIESDDGAYEVELTSKDGLRIETHVHPATGEIMNGYDD